MDAVQLKCVNKKTIYLVAGFMRELETLFGNKNYHIYAIPDGIINICIIYYFQAEFFSVCGKNMAISTTKIKNDTFGTVMKQNSGWNSVYGSFIIDESNSINSIFRWKLKINSNEIVIGLDSSDKVKINTDITAYDDNPYYGYYSQGELHSNQKPEYCKYGGQYSNGCIIIMELNYKEKTLKYIVDEKDLGIAYKNISIHHKYRLCVSILKESVQILDFQIV